MNGILCLVGAFIISIPMSIAQDEKPSLAAHFASTVTQQGIEQAIVKFRSIRQLGTHRLLEAEMNDLGYRLMAENQIDKAAACFLLIVESFPESPNAYDSLAEAYLATGNTEQAVVNYRKAIELNPDNGAARAIVWRLTRQQKATEARKTRMLDQVSIKPVIDEAAKNAMQEHHLVGAAVVVVQNGRTVFKNGYGVSDLSTQSRVDPDRTIFRIGSISKALTLLTLTRLVDQQRLQQHDNIEKFYGPIPNPRGLRSSMTIAHLMTHTSGLDQIGISRQIRQFDLPLTDRFDQRPGLEQFLRNNNVRRISEPGLLYRYDTYGTTLAGWIIERVTGQPYRVAMRNQMFDPLGMDHTFVDAALDTPASLALGYEWYNGRSIPQPYEVYASTPASSIDSTPADMARLLEALTSNGSNSHGQFLSSRMTQAVLAPQYRPHPDFPGTTHGFHESFDASGDFAVPVRSVDHGGTMAGFKSLLTILPEYKLGVYVVTNTSVGGRNPLAAAVMRSIVSQLPDLPRRRPYIVPERDPNKNLDEFAGDYSYAMYCHSCTPTEFAQGGWQPGPPTVVSIEDGALRIRQRTFLPEGGDIFVRDDGLQKVFFGRNQQGTIRFFTYSTSNDAFEKVPDGPVYSR